MEQCFHPKARIELDPIGQFFACIRGRKRHATFRISAHLKELLVPKVLQQALNDLVRRLPFLNVCMRRGFFRYYHEALPEPPQIEVENDNTIPTGNSCYTTHTGSLLRVFYGKRHFTVEAMHSVSDGRGMATIIKTLLSRYFELLGIMADKSETMIDCSETVQPGEAENAFANFGKLKKTQSLFKKYNVSLKNSVYHFDRTRATIARLVTQKLDLGKIKAAAKACSATINVYLLAHIFKAIAEERAARGCKKPISALVPIDCRGFFPHKTLRNFVSSVTVIMPETENFSEMTRRLQSQAASIDKDFILSDIIASEKARRNLLVLPLTLTKWMMKTVERLSSRGITTMFSNVGLVKLPKVIEERIEMLVPDVGSIPPSPCSFACMTIGNVLTFTITVGVENSDIAERVIKGLEMMAIC